MSLQSSQPTSSLWRFWLSSILGIPPAFLLFWHCRCQTNPERLHHEDGRWQRTAECLWVMKLSWLSNQTWGNHIICDLFTPTLLPSLVKSLIFTRAVEQWISVSHKITDRSMCQESVPEMLRIPFLPVSNLKMQFVIQILFNTLISKSRLAPSVNYVCVWVGGGGCILTPIILPDRVCLLTDTQIQHKHNQYSKVHTSLLAFLCQ